jgi:LacI family transcriptional regulator
MIVQMQPPDKANKLRRPTLDDVARLAGVGKMTVSRAINGHPYVSAEVAKRVQAAIRKLKYKPNAVAQMLTGRPSRIVGLVVPSLEDPFFSVLTQSVQETARQHNYQVWIAVSNSDVSIEKAEVDEMIGRAVEGLLLVSAKGDDPYLRSAASAGIPFVAIDRSLDKVLTDSIEVENYKGAREAVEHLIAHGRKRILCLGYDARQAPIAQRILGYRDAVQSARLPLLVEVLQDSSRALSESLDGILRKRGRIDAIFTVNNVSTLHALESLNNARIRIPSEVALIGFDDLDAWRVTNPTVTAVRQPIREIGSLAVRILLDRIQSTGKSATRTVLPTTLVLRRSCGCPAASEPRA